jgi:phytoene synthase
MLMRSTPELSTAYDLQACVAMMRGGSKSFFAASKLLPQRVRAASIALYAFCRVADDLVDEGESSDEALDELKARLDAIYSGHPQAYLEDNALAMVVHQYQLPRAMLEALIEGFAWDAQGKTYQTIEEVHQYGARVAGSVGAMMCWIMGPRHASALARACELGVAMQLTNIARDVGEDARRSRLYLPHAWMREVGIEPTEWLKAPVFSTALQIVIGRVLDEAEQLYKKAQDGIAELPKDCRAAILAARLIYAEIGQQLRRDGCNAIDHRTVVSTTRKFALLGQSKLQAGWLTTPRVKAAPLEAIQYLIDACEQSELGLPKGITPPQPRSIAEKIEWMLILSERVEAQRRGITLTDGIPQ